MERLLGLWYETVELNFQMSRRERIVRPQIL